MHSPITVLLVEDNSDNARVVMDALAEAAGPAFAVLRVDRVAAALERIHAGGIDVVLLDLGLPDSQGAATFDAVHRDAPDLPVIVYTGLGDEALALQLLRRGAQDYLVKGEADGRATTRAIRYALERSSCAAEALRSDDLIRKLTLAVDQSAAAVIITDTDGTIEYVNRRFVESTGYTAAEALGSSPRMLQSGLTPHEVYHDLWQTIGHGDVWRGEIQNRNKNGGLRWHALAIAPVRDATGLVTHFLATQEDVTERNESERTLREREKRFRQLAENISEVFFVLAADLSETLYINPAYETIWGRTCQSLYEDPQSFLIAVAPEDRNAVLAAIALIQQGEVKNEVEFRVIRPDGSLRWVMARSAGIRDDKGVVYRISGVVLDVTERHRMEDALREGAALYQKLIETSFDGIVRTEDGVVREANTGFASMFGATVDELVGRPVSDLVAEESLADVTDRMARQIEGTYELTGKRKDGTKIHLEAAARTHDIGGKRGRLTAVRDVTQKRVLEEQFRQAQKMEAVGRLAGGVAHDFNNLLMVITGYGELLLDDLGPADPRRSHVDEVLKAARGAAGLTRQLLAFSRQQIIQPRLLSLEEVVHTSEKMLRRLIGEDVELVTALSPTPATVRIDPSQLEQVIMNLVVNARDAMPGGGRITIETTSIEMSDAYARTHWPATPGRYAMLAVTDTGIGMDEATRAHVFEPFFTTKEIGKGTGLGLSMVYGIVKQSGGFIWVYSEPGQGATFKIYLPHVDETAESIRHTSEIEVIPRGTETVLLVEDEPAVRAVVHEVLERHGYHVLVAPEGQLALKLLAAHPGTVQLLITDVVMPGMSGRQLAVQFSALRPEARVLFMSGYTSDAVVRHGVLEPGIAYLQKPFSPEALVRKVRHVLDQS